MQEGLRVEFERRLRPLRVGYRVNPLGREDLGRAIETATAQWGGMYHPLIPVMGRRPAWWRDQLDPQPDAKAIERRHLDVFRCDYVVDARRGARTSAVTYQTITFEMLRRDSGMSGIEAGFPASAVWHEYWWKEFRFTPHGLPSIVRARPTHPRMELFCEACFGRLSQSEDLGAIGDVYRRAFEPNELEITPCTLLDGFRRTAEKRFVGPLQLAAWDLTVHRAAFEPALTLLLVNPEQSVDLFEFWNLRALGRDVVPIPLEWAADCVPLLATRIAQTQADDRDWRDEPVVVGARRVRDDAVDSFARGLADHGLQVTRGHLLDDRRPRPAAATVTAREDETEQTLRNGRFQLHLLSPDASRHYPGGVSRWMNVVNPRKWTLPSDGSIAPVVPTSLGQVSALFGSLGPLDVRATEEGLAIPSGARGEDVTLELPSGRAVLSEVFRSARLTPRRSDPGSVADRLIAQLGGLHMVPVLRHWEVVRLLNDAAGLGAVIDEREEPRGRRRHAAFFKHGQLREALGRAAETDRQRENILRTLVARDVLRAGLTLRCGLCGYTNWIELTDIAATMRCERCLQDCPFPVGNPPQQSQWAYRPTGAFSVPDYANGSYTVAFALNFLQPDFERMTWCTGTHLATKLEVDFSAFREEAEARPALVLGEAKSENRFTDTDFDRAVRLRRLFPDAVLAFATLRSELEDDERSALTRLARPVIQHAKHVPAEPRVLVLTHTELLHPRGAPECWRDAPNPARELAANLPQWGRAELASWCDLTLQLHLGLDSHHSWARAEYDRLRPRRRPRTANGG